VGQNLTALSINLNIVQLESAAAMTSQSAERLQDSLDLVAETREYCSQDAAKAWK